jgi:hypothetical protein
MAAKAKAEKEKKNKEAAPEVKQTAKPTIEVILGGEKYQLRYLVIKESREWRRKAAPFEAAIARYASINAENTEEFEKAFNELLTSRIDEAIDLFFDYARDLNREEIEGVASDAEIIEALKIINAAAFPME